MATTNVCTTSFLEKKTITLEMFKSGSSIKEKFGFNSFSNFKWQQLICALPLLWRKIIKEIDIADNLLLPNHYLIKTNTLLGIQKLNSRQLYSLFVYTYPFTPTTQKYFIKLFKTGRFDWKVWNLSSTTFDSPWQLLSFLSI